MYNYQTERPQVLSPEGQALMFRVLRRVQRILPQSGAVRLQEVAMGEGGDSFLQLAVMDYLVEQGFLREIIQSTSPPGQYRVFVGG